MKTVLRFLLRLLMGCVALAGILAALAAYLLYTPNPELPRLSGTVTANSIVINGQKRTYQTYVPKGLAPGAPLVLAMHGSGENGTTMRIETGYAFERLADERGFSVVYPDGQNGHWNTCEIDRDATQPDIDDVQFLTALADKFIGETGTDRNRVCHSDSRHKRPTHSIRGWRGKPVIRPHKESQISFITRDGAILCGPP